VIKEKFSPHAPSKSLRLIGPKFRLWPAIDAPYKWPKFGARSGHSFSARQKSGLSECQVKACNNSSRRSTMTLLSQN